MGISNNTGKKRPANVASTTNAGTSKSPSITVDIQKLFVELDNYMEGDFTSASDEELSDFILELTLKVYKITYNALDYANKRMDIVNLPALGYINDVRRKKVTYSQSTLNDMDQRGPLVYSVISKLDMIDSSMGANLMLALKQSAR